MALHKSLSQLQVSVRDVSGGFGELGTRRSHPESTSSQFSSSGARSSEVLHIKPAYSTQSDAIIGVVNSEAILADVIRIYIYIYIYIHTYIYIYIYIEREREREKERQTDRETQRERERERERERDRERERERERDRKRDRERQRERYIYI